MTYEFNDLKIRCDWMSFTLDSMHLIENLGYFGFSYDDFNLMDRGAQGYKHMLRHPFHEITVLYDGAVDMGIHIDVKGSAVAFFLRHFRDSFMTDTPFGPAYEEIEEDFIPDDILPYLFQTILKHGHFTRLDIAVDDLGCHYFSLPDLAKILNSGNYVSKFRKWKHIVEKDTSGKITGNTIYMGSRQSDVMLRIYDKQLEQMNKETDTHAPWVRWEFELKDMRACAFADFVIQDKRFGILGMQLLSNYLRFILLDGSNKTRCSTLPLWQKFVSDVGGLQLSLPKTEKSVERSMNWIKKQCLPTIAGLTLANAGDMTFLTEHLAEHYDRLCAESKHVFESYLESYSDIVAADT